MQNYRDDRRKAEVFRPFFEFSRLRIGQTLPGVLNTLLANVSPQLKNRLVIVFRFMFDDDANADVIVSSTNGHHVNNIRSRFPKQWVTVFRLVNGQLFDVELLFQLSRQHLFQKRGGETRVPEGLIEKGVMRHLVFVTLLTRCLPIE